MCKYCNEEIKSKDKRQKYCNRSCAGKDRKTNKVTVHCKNCDKALERYPSQVLSSVYCSQKCRSDFNSMTIECDICSKEINRKNSHYKKTKYNYCSYECSDLGFSKFYKGEDNPNFLNTYTNCSYCDKEIYRKKSEFERSVNFFCSVGCQSSWQSENMVGKNHPNYDDSISSLDRERGRNHEGYWQFRRAVYERDNYTCQICGYDKGGTLNAHHLNSYNWDIENRTNVDNAITLCGVCHKDFHSIYGNKKNTKEQFEEHMQNI